MKLCLTSLSIEKMTTLSVCVLVFYCYKINYHKCTGLQQDFSSLFCRTEVQHTSGRFFAQRLTQNRNQGDGCTALLSRGLGQESTSMLIQLAGLILFSYYSKIDVTMFLLAVNKELLTASRNLPRPFSHGPFHLQTSNGQVRRVSVRSYSSLISFSAPVKDKFSAFKGLNLWGLAHSDYLHVLRTADLGLQLHMQNTFTIILSFMFDCIARR